MSGSGKFRRFGAFLCLGFILEGLSKKLLSLNQGITITSLKGQMLSNCPDTFVRGAYYKRCCKVYCRVSILVHYFCRQLKTHTIWMQTWQF